MYVLGFVLGLGIAKRRSRQGLLSLSEEKAESLITYLIIGMAIGARLFYIIFYNLNYYLANPLEVLKVWQGGLSFHGAAFGMTIACIVFAKRNKRPAPMIFDTLALGCLPGLFFGRLGNFINAELWGRASEVPWAMRFPGDPSGLARHPSQLYQALGEGLLLFIILNLYQKNSINRKSYRLGSVGALFLIFYGAIRFVIEFFREPDAQLGLVLGPLSMGQILCIAMILCGFAVRHWVKKNQAIYQVKK